MFAECLKSKGVLDITRPSMYIEFMPAKNLSFCSVGWVDPLDLTQKFVQGSDKLEADCFAL